MTWKNVLTISLLMFVLASIVVLTVQALQPPPAGAPVAEGTIIYYLHGNKRCPDCKLLQSCADEAVREVFGEQLDGGEVTYEVGNYTSARFAQFAADMNIASPTVAIVRVQSRPVLRLGEKSSREEILDYLTTQLQQEKSGTVETIEGGEFELEPETTMEIPAPLPGTDAPAIPLPGVEGPLPIPGGDVPAIPQTDEDTPPLPPPGDEEAPPLPLP